MQRKRMEINEGLAKWIGLILSDGSTGRHSIQFFNNEEAVIEEFEMLTKSLFELEVHKIPMPTTRKANTLQVNSARLVQGLNEIFNMSGIKKGECGIPEILMSSEDKIKARLLQGLYDGDGSVYYNKKFHVRSVNLASKKPKILKDVSKIDFSFTS